MISLLAILLLSLVCIVLVLLVPARDRMTVLLIAFISIAVVGALLLDLRDRWRNATPLPAEVLTRHSHSHIAGR